MRNKTLARLEEGGSAFFDGRVTLPAGTTFLHINTLAHSAGSARSRKTFRACAKAVGSAKGLKSFPKLTLVKVDPAGRLSPKKTCLLLNGNLDTTQLNKGPPLHARIK